MARTVVGLFDNFTDAQNCLRALTDRGFPRDDISLVASDPAGEYRRTYVDRAADTAADVGGDTLSGAATGAAVGGGIGLLAGLAALAIPGVGPIVALGSVGTALAGAAVGAGIGGIVGALSNLGVPEEQAGYYAEGVRRGGTLLTVTTATEERADEARSIMEDHNVADINERVSAWRESGWTGYNPGAEPMTAEEIEAERRARERRMAA